MKIRLKYNAPVVLTFAILSGLVLLLSYMLGPSFQMYFVSGRGNLLSPLTWIRTLTYVLGHASLDHYMNNMMFFLLLGPGIEEKYGSRNTLIIILITAFATALCNMLITDSGLIGASGVVFAFIVLSSMTSFQKGEIPLTMIVVVLLYLGQEVYNGLSLQDNISQLGHILGGCIGAICGFLLAKEKKGSYAL